ncbi:class I SAM-dependent methyltransferase [Halieaceae bacterium IMCC14734]|uniref:Class I SAM-dependent methyltransferase n=1 Tax=Candidatus Litorirhabdus singularis TaxID=2518993 RepID=A0ABT3TB17_9GAMM|nr:class I SAM-dependent methyltransferase [Candidatus Litorirhabdus singularis]
MDSSCPCPLCGYGRGSSFHRDRRREYLRCPVCALVYVPPVWHLDAAAEKAVYDLHENSPDDPGYRRFLSRLAAPLLTQLGGRSALGLDFGCGPGPALVQMLREAGHTVSVYDPYYFPDTAVLSVDYDFITATEVVEHLAAPGLQLDRLWSLLRPGGVLGVMTKLVVDQQAFARWHYISDATHICFFSQQTWRWWSLKVGAELEQVAADAVLFRKPHL